MLTDIKSGIQLIIFVIIIGVIGMFLKDAIPAATQAATLPERIKVENAQLQAQAAVAPTMEHLRVVATLQAIENIKVIAQAQANAQVVQAQGTADGTRTLTNAVMTLVIGSVGFVILWFLGRMFLGLFLMSRAEKHGGAVAILPSGETRYMPADSNSRMRLSSGNAEHVISQSVRDSVETHG